MKKISIALAILGLLLATLLIGWFGTDHVFGALLSVGWHGFGVLVIWQMLLFAVLALAWTIIASCCGEPRYTVYLWGRMVRDAATSCLPFSPVGGFVLGARAVTLHGVRIAAATASTVVDVTAEVLAQLAFAAIGLCILIARDPDTRLAVPLAVILGLGLAAIGGFAWAQRGAAAIFNALGRRIAGQWFDGATDRVALLQTELTAIYARPGRLALACGVHLLGWLGTGIGDWIAYRLLGVDITLPAALAIDALLNTVLAAAFLVPGYAGVQEAAYAAIGSLFGIPPDMSLGVSLLRRARDILVGVPTLLAWQVIEMRRLRSVPDV